MLLIAVMISGSCWAEDLSFSIDGKKASFVRDPARHLTLSNDCVHGKAKPKCEAYTSLAHATLKDIVIKGGANPGAVVCSVKLNGDVVVGTDDHGNQNSFCRFQDGSMVSNGSVAYRARQNDSKQKD